MAKLWTRVHKWIHPRECEGDKNLPRHSLEAHLQRAALARRHSQSALAPQIGTSGGEPRSGNVRRQQSRSLSNALREPHVLQRLSINLRDRGISISTMLCQRTYNEAEFPTTSTIFHCRMRLVNNRTARMSQNATCAGARCHFR